MALVVGNAAYKLGPLANPVHDAEAIAEKLEKELKFDKVLLKRDLGLDAFQLALRELAREAREAEVGLVFFAGHGIETDGRNYLIPTDAALTDARDIKLEAIALNAVLEHLEGVASLRLVILDACRINPFPAAGRSWRGLKSVEPELGTLVAYAAKDGTLAADGDRGLHSPFTAALLKRIGEPGLDVRRVFGYVSTEVKFVTGGRQEPWLYGHLGGDEVYLARKAAGVPAGQPGLGLPPSPAAQAWEAAKGSTSIALLETFRRQYGVTDGFYDRLAAERIEEVRQLGEAEARRQRLASLKAEEDRKRAEEESRRLEDARKRDPALGVRPGSAESFRDRTADGRDCPECPEMVVVPPGTFMMGSPDIEQLDWGSWQKATKSLKSTKSSQSPKNSKYSLSVQSPQRQVTISKAFAVGKFEVTFDAWDACVDAGACRHRPEDQGWGRGTRPVINVSWDDTQQYVGWLSRKTGKTYRLLTDAEWEYVARAGTATPFWWGSSISPSQANYHGGYTYAGGGSTGEYRRKTVPVDSFAANPWGLYNVHGNVWEWVQDCWYDNSTGAPTDGSALAAGDCGRRILRGGSWVSDPQSLRSAARRRVSAVVRYDLWGFRLARTLNP